MDHAEPDSWFRSGRQDGQPRVHVAHGLGVGSPQPPVGRVVANLNDQKALKIENATFNAVLSTSRTRRATWAKSLLGTQRCIQIANKKRKREQRPARRRQTLALAPALSPTTLFRTRPRASTLSFRLTLFEDT